MLKRSALNPAQRLLFASWLVLLMLSGCQESQQPIEPQVRAIKTLTVTELAGGQRRSYSGVVQAADSSALSSSVSGKLIEVKVKRGEQVKAGDLLATLDSAPFELDVSAAEAELQKAKAAYQEKAKDYQRKNQLVEKGWVSRTSVDQARAAMKAASSDVNYATSRLNQASRDLDDTRLYAPFDGVVADVKADSFKEVKAGDPVIELYASGLLEVEVGVPEQVIERIGMGTPARVQLSGQSQQELQGRITEVGSVAGSGQLFPVTVSLIEPPAMLRPGMAADVSVQLAETDSASGYLLPLSAVIPNKDLTGGAVYVYDPATSTVRKRTIRVGGARENLLEIIDGVKAGEIVAIAGVSFLSDGKKVKLLDAQQGNGGSSLR